MKFCDNTIVLIIFFLLKIFIYIIFPLIIIKGRKKEYTRYLMIFEMVLIILFLFSNVFTLNSCVYNSNVSGIKKVQLKNKIINYNSLHYDEDEYTYITDLEPEILYKTYNGKSFYYYNQNNIFLKQQKLECGEKKYFNKYGSAITATSMAVSTIMETNISPIDILDLYNSSFYDCSSGVNIGDIFELVAERYHGIQINEIPGSMVMSSLLDGGIVIAHISSNGTSKITCGSNYIVLYNITLDGKVIIADPNDSDYSYVCSSTSQSYGSTLEPNRTNTQWSLDEINSQTLHYYLIKGV